MKWREEIQTRVDAVRARIPVQYIMQQWMRLPPPMRLLPAHVWRAIKNFERHGPRQAAALSYYAIFSVFPLTLLLAVAVSTLVGPTVAQQQIADGLRLFLPEETETINLVQENIGDALSQSSSFGLVALAGLIWSALGLFSNLTGSLDMIFQAPSGRSLWRKRLLAFVMTLILITLVITSFVTSGLLRLLDALLLSNTNIWLSIGTFFLPFGLNMLIFVLLFRYVPSRHVHWDAVWPAAILGGVGLELAKTGFGWYFSLLSNFQFVYGSIATAIVLLLWAFLVACIFLFCAELCSQLNLWLMAQDDTPRVKLYTETSYAHLPAEVPPPV